MPYLDEDVHDVEGLAIIRRHLFAAAEEQDQLLADAAG